MNDKNCFIIFAKSLQKGHYAPISSKNRIHRLHVTGDYCHKTPGKQQSK